MPTPNTLLSAAILATAFMGNAAHALSNCPSAKDLVLVRPAEYPIAYEVKLKPGMESRWHIVLSTLHKSTGDSMYFSHGKLLLLPLPGMAMRIAYETRWPRVDLGSLGKSQCEYKVEPTAPLGSMAWHLLLMEA